LERLYSPAYRLKLKGNIMTINYNSKQSGFTLVELSIVLVIIGLLLGGILKGQEMIENGKIKNLENDVKGITAAYYAYRDRYNALPGDDPRALLRWTAAVPAAVNGTGDGIVATAVTWSACGVATTAPESCLFFQDLRLAGLLTGAGPSDPINAYGGVIRVIQNDNSVPANTAMGVGLNLCFGNLPSKAAEAVDATFDDGNPTTGNVRAVAGAGNATPVAAATGVTYVDSAAITTYTVCKLL
jgi:prepilin-type N-terminal cleavage/methylation domain-containing protein